MLDIFFYEAFAEEDQAIRRYLPPDIQAGFTWKTIQEENPQTPPAPLISIRTQSLLPTEWAIHLDGILTRSTGYDHIHGYWQTCQKQVLSGYLPLYCHRAVAEQTMLLWMSLLRKLPKQVQQFQSFHRDGLTGQECFHKTLLVVGVGNIGYEVIQIGRGLGMLVLGVDINKKHTDVNYVSIEEGLKHANIIVCAMDLTSQNVDYFNYSLLKRAKLGVIFVNIARGEFSPTADLLRLLEEGHLGGVALDVYDQETEIAVALRKGEIANCKEALLLLELAKHPNVILTPHNAFNTQEAVDRKAQHSVLQVKQFLSQGRFLWPVPPYKLASEI